MSAVCMVLTRSYRGEMVSCVKLKTLICSLPQYANVFMLLSDRFISKYLIAIL